MFSRTHLYTYIYIYMHKHIQLIVFPVWAYAWFYCLSTVYPFTQILFSPDIADLISCVFGSLPSKLSYVPNQGPRGRDATKDIVPSLKAFAALKEDPMSC